MTAYFMRGHALIWTILFTVEMSGKESLNDQKVEAHISEKNHADFGFEDKGIAFAESENSLQLIHGCMLMSDFTVAEAAESLTLEQALEVIRESKSLFFLR